MKTKHRIADADRAYGAGYARERRRMKMYQRKWKGEADWIEITEQEARTFGERYYHDVDAALSSVRDGCDMNTPFAWIRWVPR